jgi:hypothetical protein
VKLSELLKREQVLKGKSMSRPRLNIDKGHQRRCWRGEKKRLIYFSNQKWFVVSRLGWVLGQRLESELKEITLKRCKRSDQRSTKDKPTKELKIVS